MQTKNQNFLNFLHDGEGAIDNIWQALLKIKNDITIGEIDFEIPQNENQTLKLFQNILTSLLLNLIEVMETLDNKTEIIKIISQVAQMLKSSLNL